MKFSLIKTAMDMTTAWLMYQHIFPMTQQSYAITTVPLGKFRVVKGSSIEHSTINENFKNFTSGSHSSSRSGRFYSFEVEQGKTGSSDGKRTNLAC